MRSSGRQSGKVKNGATDAISKAAGLTLPAKQITRDGDELGDAYHEVDNVETAVPTAVPSPLDDEEDPNGENEETHEAKTGIKSGQDSPSNNDGGNLSMDTKPQGEEEYGGTKAEEAKTDSVESMCLTLPRESTPKIVLPTCTDPISPQHEGLASPVAAPVFPSHTVTAAIVKLKQQSILNKQLGHDETLWHSTTHTRSAAGELASAALSLPPPSPTMSIQEPSTVSMAHVHHHVTSIPETACLIWELRDFPTFRLAAKNSQTPPLVSHPFGGGCTIRLWPIEAETQHIKGMVDIPASMWSRDGLAHFTVSVLGPEVNGGELMNDKDGVGNAGASTPRVGNHYSTADMRSASPAVRIHSSVHGSTESSCSSGANLLNRRVIVSRRMEVKVERGHYFKEAATFKLTNDRPFLQLRSTPLKYSHLLNPADGSLTVRVDMDYFPFDSAVFKPVNYSSLQRAHLQLLRQQQGYSEESAVVDSLGASTPRSSLLWAALPNAMTLPSPYQTMIEDLAAFCRTEVSERVELRCQGRSIIASRTLLMARSSRFRDMVHSSQTAYRQTTASSLPTYNGCPITTHSCGPSSSSSSLSLSSWGGPSSSKIRQKRTQSSCQLPTTKNSNADSMMMMMSGGGGGGDKNNNNSNVSGEGAGGGWTTPHLVGGYLIVKDVSPEVLEQMVQYISTDMCDWIDGQDSMSLPPPPSALVPPSPRGCSESERPTPTGTPMTSSLLLPSAEGSNNNNITVNGNELSEQPIGASTLEGQGTGRTLFTSTSPRAMSTPINCKLTTIGGGVDEIKLRPTLNCTGREDTDATTSFEGGTGTAVGDKRGKGESGARRRSRGGEAVVNKWETSEGDTAHINLPINNNSVSSSSSTGTSLMMSRPPTSFTNSIALFIAADEYKIRGLIPLAGDVLERYHLKRSTVVELWDVAESCSYEPLKQACIEFMNRIPGSEVLSMLRKGPPSMGMNEK